MDWLIFLWANHPDYRNLAIDEDNLLALPEVGPITEQLPACEVNEPFFPNPNDILNSKELPNADSNKLDDENLPHQTAVTPNLLPDQTEMKRLQQVLTQATHPVDLNVLSMASVAETSFGLVNGTLGTLYDMMWRSEDDPLISLPCVLWFILNKYAENGPCQRTPEGQPMIPIIPIQREWEVGSVTYS